MIEGNAPRLNKWPFFIADGLMLAVAGYIALHPSTEPWWMLFLLGAVSLAAWISVMPFLAQHRADVKFAEAASLTTAVEQIANLRSFTNQISFATAQWQVVQDEAYKTVGTAKQIAERMAVEAKAFSDFMQKASDSEKVHLRLEVEKLRRTESEWLQVLVMMLDHVYALSLAGRRSGQQNIIQQLAVFQNACRDSARRVGLVAFEAQTNEPFNPQMHQLLNSDAPIPKTARVAQTLASGYMFQGQLIRNAVISLQVEEPATPLSEPELVFDGSS